MQFLRKVQQGRWEKYPKIAWLKKGELKGDVLADVSAIKGKLSVYRIDSDDDFQRVVTALAANRNNIAHLDYVLFEGDNLDSFGIRINSTNGTTADDTTNELHYELENLSVERLVRLVKVIADGKHDRILKKQIKDWLQEAASSGHLDKTKLDPNIMNELK